ncbi:MAG: hypothetical protein LBL06_01140 [Treponema sp.]|jgi:hypothetical protein|nr:hypothetical protein [Treponema sp.]
MKKISGLLVFCVVSVAWMPILAFAQEGNSLLSEVTGMWRHEKEGLTFQFNVDGTFSMSEDGEEARKAIESESRKRGEAMSTSVGGTYTVSKGVINIVMNVDGKSHRLRMSYKKVNADTLQLDKQNYHRVNR